MQTKQIREHMEVVGADEEHVGTVDGVDGGQIKLTKSDPASITSSRSPGSTPSTKRCASAWTPRRRLPTGKPKSPIKRGCRGLHAVTPKSPALLPRGELR